MPKYSMIVLSRPTEGREEEYNSWYNDIHLPEVLGTEGFVAAQRFKFVGGPNEVAPYLAVYEIESIDFPTSFAKLVQRVEEGKIMLSSALDASNTLAAGYEAITPRVTA